MSNISLSSLFGFILSLPAAFFFFMWSTNSLDRGYGSMALALFVLATSITSVILSLVSFAFVFKGYQSKYLTFIALLIDIALFIVIATDFS